MGPNSTAHRYRNLTAPLKDVNNPVFSQYYPQNHYSHDYFSFATGIFLEFLRYDHIRWQTELEYTNKGAVEREIINWYTGERGGTGANVYQYIQFNNYLKYMGNASHRGQWYLMFGIKLEYNMGRATPIFTPISGTFPKIWWSGDAAVGYEFFTWKRIHPFVEFHYNPDLMYQPPRLGSTVRSRTFELRIGLIYRPAKRSIDDCNAPTYHGNYY
ncbi:MAG: hypothetical protein ACXVP0_06735 [Bacteroidia bacterium]